MRARKILIIDNDRVITKLMETFLSREGHQIKKAHDAFEALDILKSYHPEIIYVDRIMPKIGGDKLCQIIRAMPQFRSCHIVIISATLAEESVDLARIGANSAIIKCPFDIMTKYIAETIQEADSPTPPTPHIKGLGHFAPRYITQELLSQNKYLQTLLETISQGVLELENNRVLYANQSAIDILKTKREILLGSFLNEIVDNRLWKILGSRIFPCQNRSLKEEEKEPIEIYEKHIVLQCLKIEHENNKRVVLLSDITERKRMEAIVEATNLTENLGYIFSGIRHEIGNPVNSIKMALTVLQKHLDSYDKETIAEFTSRSLEEVARLEYLLKALRNYSLFEKPLVQDVELYEFMDNFIPLVKSDLESKGIEVRTKFVHEKLIALTDIRALHHVLLNLITNAADAVAGEEKPYITIAVKKGPSSIIIKVDDNGCGIANEDQVSIFTPFYTSKPQGTGLGLSIVKKMLTAMNSQISVESIEGFGTTATITLPEGQ